MIVMKFGGTSVENASAITRVVAIIRANRAACPVVVVSAIGKSTNRLLHAAEYAARGEADLAWRKLLALEADHLQMASKLGLKLDREIEELFGELRGNVLEIAGLRVLTPAMWDRVAGFGERLSSVIVAGALNQAGIAAKHLDARSLIVTDERHTAAIPLAVETYARIRRAIPCPGQNAVPVLGGFVGATADGTPTTLGRGGSDLTASLVGAAINAEEIEIWTDVDGMLTCDPRVANCGYCLRSVTYAEAEQMARFGAKVLHPDTVAPARKQRVPVSIHNSRNPAQPGTSIGGNSEFTGQVKCIATLADVGLLCLVGEGIGREPEIAERALKTLQAAGLMPFRRADSELSMLLSVAPRDVPVAVRALHSEFLESKVGQRAKEKGKPELALCAAA